MSNVAFFVIGCLTMLVAVGSFLGAVVTYFRGKRKIESQVVAEGKVIGLNLRSMRAGSAGVYCPTVEFVASDGKTYQFDSSFGSRPASYSVGQAAKVRYDPSHPEGAEIASGLTRYLVPGILAFFMIVACCLSVFFLLAGILMTNPPRG